MQRLYSVSAVRITLYKDEYFHGKNRTITLSGSGCQPLPLDWQNVAESLDTHGNCVIVHYYWDCRLEWLRMHPRTPSHKDLKRLKFLNSNVILHRQIRALEHC